ncbi:type III secretion system stalk subunit SctO [Desulfovibrio inopinatus]|uniref:type III secretion system stalk subunit SctO n=1 Tax=Desulfovibrio inopinatus TaxID=102109 RepID=UPI0004828689|nr:YscO family type III secretion system apparatus protein [Desulfovibrio inopinatus]
MSKYPLAALLEVREHRERAAFSEVATRRVDAQEKREAVEARRKELADYIEWRERKAESMMSELTGGLHSPDHILRVVSYIQDLKHGDAEYRDKVAQAEDILRKAEIEVEKAKAKRQALTQEKEKLEKHKETWLNEEAKRQLLAEEEELEDFTSRSRASLFDGEDAL